MTNDDPDKVLGPGGMTLRQIHEQVKQSAERDRQAQVTQHKLAQPQSRWQRFVRYVCERIRR
jgi:hypothetical protein